MALDATKVMRGVTGAVFAGPSGTALPTAVNSALDAAMDDLGWIGEDGVTRSLPDTGERNVVRGWQNNGVVIDWRTPTEDLPTWSFVCLETKIEVVEFVLGVTVTQSMTDGKWIVDVEAERAENVLVLDAAHGARLRRTGVPRARVSEIGDQVFAFGEPIGWEVTVEGVRDTTLGGHYVEFDSALKL